MKFVRSRPVAIFCFLFCGTSSSVSSRSNRQTISYAFTVLRTMEGTRNSFSQTGESKKRSAIVPTSRIDLLKASAKRCRACSNSIASRQADGMDAHQVRTKTTYRANSKKVRRYSVVRACGCTSKSMVFGLDCCLVWCTYGANETQHRNRVNL